MDYTAPLMLGVVGLLFCKFVLLVLIAGFQYFWCEVQNTNTTIVKGGYLQLTCNKLDIETLKTLLMVTP